jgi:aminodeoxyfutalosine synthase
VVHNLANGIPLSRDDGHILFASKNLDTIGRIANIVKYSRFKDDAYFNVNVHINQTNICTLACKFCAFRRGRKASDAYEMDIAEYIDDLRNYSEHVDEVHSVGGLHPDWDVEHYTKLFTAVKEEFPHIHIKALTAVEVKHVANLSNMTIKDTLNQLHQAGLDSLPGGGAEILDDEVRSIICRGKESSQEYLDIHRTAHELGIPTNCTMLFGTIETIDQRITHLLRLRELQSITRGFQCFVPYPFLPDDSRLPEAQLASGSEILRVIAISRLMLDNIPHIKAYRMNIGDEISELALQYGADDIDGTVQKESIMHLAGSTAPLDHDKAQLARLVVDAGAKPVQRNTIYTVFEKYIPPKEPETRSLLMAKGD